jgi:ribonuclease P protein component
VNKHFVEDNLLDTVSIQSEELINFYFTRSQKLLTADHYKHVFSRSKRFGNKSFTLLARKNDLGYPRLGLAISKKSVKHAVDRNRIKRILRDNFRLHQHELPNVDIIAMCKPNVLLLERHEIHEQIKIQWRFMQKKFSTSTD